MAEFCTFAVILGNNTVNRWGGCRTHFLGWRATTASENIEWQVRPETKSVANAPSTYLHRFTYDTISYSKRILEFAIAEVGAERVMIGSDYCFDMG